MNLRIPFLLAAIAAQLASCSSPAPATSGAGADGQNTSDLLVFQNDLTGSTDAKAETADADGPADGAVDGAPGDAAEVVSDPFAHLCDPCAAAAACEVGGGKGNLCIQNGENGSYCGVLCSLGQIGGQIGSCPSGYSCIAIQDPDSGKASTQCTPDSGSCTCSTSAIAAKLSTPCLVTNAFGSCAGVRTCGDAGLGACDAPVPATETCNGIDDNCNGKTDEIEGKIACQNSNTLGSCGGFIKGCSGSVPLCDAPTPIAELCNGKDDNCNGDVDEGMCDDGNVCTSGLCGSDGTCAQMPLSGGKCDDGNPCTEEDICLSGQCKGKKAKCDDGNDCTTDGCGKNGCTHDNSVDPCTADNSPCTADLCSDGACTHADMAEGTTCTDDGNGCTLDGCIGGTCMHTDDPLSPPCGDDGNPCTLDVCQKSGCAHVAIAGDITCTGDGNVCTDDVCKDGACAHPASVTATTCDTDGLPCTDDVCSAGACTHPASTSGTSCPDDNKPCTNDVCSAGVCTHPSKNIGDACADDGNVCTSDTCQNGVCVHLASLVGQPCPDDNDACTIDTCTKQGGCGHALDPGKCKIGGVCYEKFAGSPGDPCKQCIPETSQTQFTGVNNQSCEDGDLCTTGEMCSSGKCSGGKAIDCSAKSSVCGTAACDKASGLCLITPKSGPCDDGDSCTASDHCSQGACIGTKPDCSAYDGPCTIGQCDGGACKLVPLTGACDDGNACTTGDACSNNKCVGSEVDCSGFNSVCGTGVCQNGTCNVIPKAGSTACDDGNGCTFNDQCKAGLCSGIPVDCGNLTTACADGVCDPSTTGCILQYKSESTPCSDGDACSLGDHCSAGKCVGTQLNCAASNNFCQTSYCKGGSCVNAPINDGFACNDGTPCTGSDKCQSGSCVGTPLKDGYEPNNSANGSDIGSKSDCDGSSGLAATLSPGSDVDFYHFHASDDTFCSIYPDVTISGLAADYDLCVWFACSDGSSGDGVVGCDAGYKVNGGPNGWSGCCSSNNGTTSEHVRHNDSCSFLGLGNDGGTVLIQVTAKNAAAAAVCGGYSLSWKAN